MLRSADHKMPIDQLFSSFQKLQTQENGNLAVLEMLTVLPEEVLEDHSGDLNVDAASRSQFTREVCLTTNFSLQLVAS
jgi:transportin-3